MTIYLPLLIFLLPTVAASIPPPTESPFAASLPSDPSTDSSFADINQTATAFFVVLLFAAFLIGFVHIYIRLCSDDNRRIPLYYSSSSSAAAAAARPRQLSPSGLDQAAIDSFPIFNYSEIKHLKMGKGTLTCAVCVCEFEDSERLRLLPKCDHVFHPECIDPWLASHSTCPICRANLREKIESTEPCNSTTEIRQVQNHNQIAITVDENQRIDTEARERARKFPRPHSTGHSLVRLGEDCERYTLRLPEEVRRQAERFDRVVTSDRWIFTMTPLFLSITGSVKSTKVGIVDGEVTAVGTSMGFPPSVKSPFECLAVESEEMQTGLPV